MKTKGKVTKIDQYIGENLKTLRTFEGLSQEQLAAELGVSFQQVQKYEKGKNRVPVSAIYQLKHLYNVPYDLFFKGIDKKTGHTKHNLDRLKNDKDALKAGERIATLNSHLLKKQIGQIVEILTEQTAPHRQTIQD